MREQVIAGDALLDFLSTDWRADHAVRVSPAPSAWSAIKPALLRYLEARRASGLPTPRFRNFPLCAFGEAHLGLDVVAEPPCDIDPAPCAQCALRPSCSPPSSWTDELQPFSAASDLERWQAFHRRLCHTTKMSPRPELDALVEAHLASGLSWTRRNPCSLEPSLQFDDALSPVLRLAIFHGPPALGDDGGRRTAILLESFAAAHAIVGYALPRGLMETLAAQAPFAFPFGFEARPDRPLLLKAYIEWPHTAPEQRKRFVGELMRCAGLDVALPALDWATIGLVGIGSCEGRLASLKIYARRDPTQAWPVVGLPAIAADHVLVRMSAGEAYAVFDLRHPDTRAPKWDFSTRRQLAPGTRVSQLLSTLLSPRGSSDLDAVVRHHDFRTDCVAVGLREGRPTIYLHLL